MAIQPIQFQRPERRRPSPIVQAFLDIGQAAAGAALRRELVDKPAERAAFESEKKLAEHRATLTERTEKNVARAMAELDLEMGPTRGALQREQDALATEATAPTVEESLRLIRGLESITGRDLYDDKALEDSYRQGRGVDLGPMGYPGVRVGNFPDIGPYPKTRAVQGANTTQQLVTTLLGIRQIDAARTRAAETGQSLDDVNVPAQALARLPYYREDDGELRPMTGPEIAEFTTFMRAEAALKDPKQAPYHDGYRAIIAAHKEGLGRHLVDDTPSYLTRNPDAAIVVGDMETQGWIEQYGGGPEGLNKTFGTQGVQYLDSFKRHLKGVNWLNDEGRRKWFVADNNEHIEYSGDPDLMEKMLAHAPEILRGFVWFKHTLQDPEEFETVRSVLNWDRAAPKSVEAYRTFKERFSGIPRPDDPDRPGRPNLPPPPPPGRDSTSLNPFGGVREEDTSSQLVPDNANWSHVITTPEGVASVASQSARLPTGDYATWLNTTNQRTLEVYEEAVQEYMADPDAYSRDIQKALEIYENPETALAALVEDRAVKPFPPASARAPVSGSRGSAKEQINRKYGGLDKLRWNVLKFFEAAFQEARGRKKKAGAPEQPLGSTVATGSNLGD